MRLLSQTFRCLKNPNHKPDISKPSSSSKTTGNPCPKSSVKLKPKPKPWCVYLIVSSNPPIKSYVGVTLNFDRRLKQHNGEIKGGAKATRAGRPWICACIINGFEDQSQACEFESKWKKVSRKMPYKRKKDDVGNQLDDQTLRLLQHRQIALEKVKCVFNCNQFEFDWRLNPF